MVLDSMTNEVLGVGYDIEAAKFDERFSEWGSVDEAFKFWGDIISKRVEKLSRVK